ncbi:tripartite tricarboxylate transporter substrate-binding protein [Rhodoferax ferrireducens]|uniref:tripartite tricarboxylate transporter substrate-binding protein n=1 Tax=Rhodoferax ferrireducens TaxID=192843 RepID=UPI000E0D1B90|nr:tripartite tricarboxylate transporter substrate-binding protein [Rhodoferax ferrireducens]
MHFIRNALIALATVASTALAYAQSYPSKPMSWVVPFAAGGPTDALARNIAERVARELGQPIIIENTPGAGGTVGAAKVAKAAPDGYTLLVGHMGYMGAAPALYKKLNYDPVKDFDGVFRFPDTPLVLMVRADHPVKDIAGLIDFGKKNPDKLFLSNAGTGSSSHLIAALMANSAGIKITSVPYKGAGPALTDVIGGQVDGMFDQTNTALQQITSGKVRALAVTSLVRLPQLKNVPTLNETVLPGFEASTWYGIYAPKGTPKAVVEKVQNAYLKVMKDTAFTGRMAEQAIQMLPPEKYSGAALAKLTETEVVRWRAVAAKSGLALD